MRMIMCGLVKWLTGNALFLHIITNFYPTIMSDLEWFSKNYYLDFEGKEYSVVPYQDTDQGRDEGDPWA
jgi:hypothetical protein